MLQASLWYKYYNKFENYFVLCNFCVNFDEFYCNFELFQILDRGVWIGIELNFDFDFDFDNVENGIGINGFLRAI